MNKPLKVWDEHAAEHFNLSPDSLPMELCTVACSRCPRKMQVLLPLGIVTREAMRKIGWKLEDQGGIMVYTQPVCSQHFAESEVS